MGQYLAKLQYRQERRLIVSCTVCCYRYCSDERLKTSLYPPYGWQQLMYPQLVTIASHGPSDSGTNKYQTVFARFWLTPILSYSRNSLRVARFLSWYVFALFISTQYFLWRTGWHVCMQNGVNVLINYTSISWAVADGPARRAASHVAVHRRACSVWKVISRTLGH